MPQERTPNYFYVGNEIPSKCNTIVPERKAKKNNASDLLNPLFNFDRSFGEDLLKLKPIDLAQSVPYISIKIMDLGGKVLDDLNVSFFQKQIDFSKINGPERFTDRPLLSLSSVEISTDLSFGPMYMTSVDLNIKIHKKDQLSDRTILGLLFPGCPILLEYGWNSPSEFLNNSKQKLLLSVTNYEISLDETGQADLIVHCMGFQDLFNNTIIGDLNTIEFSKGDKEEKELAGLFHNYKHLSKFLEYLEALKNTDSNNSNDYSLVKDSAKSYKNLEQKTLGKISKNFSIYLQALSNRKLRNNITFRKEKTNFCN